MKRLLLVIISILILSACSSAPEAVEDTQTMSIKVKTVEVKEEEEAPIIIEEPGVDVDLKDSKPWEVYSGTDLINLAQKQKVFTYEDAPQLEDDLISDLSRQTSDGKWRSWNASLGVFYMQVSEYYPEMDEYFEKVKETADLIMETNNKEEVINSMKEAKEIREQLEDAN